MRHGRFITTALVAVAGMAIGPSVAAAAPSPLSDDSIENFAAGTAGIDTWAVEPGVVRLLRSPVSENFPGSALPGGWTATPWTPGQGGGSVAGGSVTVDGARVNDSPMYAPTPTQPLTLEFRATFGNVIYQNVGFGDTFGTPDGPWAMFSTGSNTPALPFGLYARTVTPGGMPSDPLLLPAVDPLLPHVYRIEWSTSDVKFYVDNNLVNTSNIVVAGPMRPVASDLDAGGPSVKVDWFAMGTTPSSGMFASRVLQADDPHTVWGTVKETGAGSGAAFETRTGNTTTPDSTWSDWQAVGSGGAIQSPAGRQNVQYKATLSSATATLDKVTIDYTTDTTAPGAAIDSVQVSATNASASFSSPDGDIAGFECSLDSAAFAPCTSPKELTGLAAGSHTFAVRGVDKAGNVGAADSKTFSIASPPAAGGATQQPSGGSSAVDTTAPKVSVVAKSLRASKKSAVSFRVGCPATETSCKVTLKLKNGSSSAASKTVTVKGSKTVTITLTLNKATRQLLKHGSLKVSAVYTATDAAGNHTTTTKRMTLSKAAA
jgi:hypothetical protein